MLLRAGTVHVHMMRGARDPRKCGHPRPGSTVTLGRSGRMMASLNRSPT